MAASLPLLASARYHRNVLARILRLLAIVTLAGGSIYAASLYGRFAALIASLTVLLALMTVLVWLPRAAHAAFKSGRFGRARALYVLLCALRASPDARGGLLVSLAACALGRHDADTALAILQRAAPDELGEAARAAWLNNRAYALARDRRDADEALAHADGALALRPNVIGFRHTRGIALLAVGRVDDAIGELDSLWNSLGDEEPHPLLEAERCYDLARAWRAKGEHEYAADYFDRARRAAPDSEWSRRASELAGPHRRADGIADLV